MEQRRHSGPVTVVGGFVRGLKTGAKANVNGAATAIVRTVTLGLIDNVELISVTDADRAAGYNTAIGFATAAGEILIGVGTAGMATALANGGKVARAADGALTVVDASGNVVGVVKGVSDGDAVRIAGSALGLGANAKALKELKSAARAAKAKGVAPTTKKVPNPYGKLGSPAHRAKVRDVVSDIEARGLQARTEVPIKSINGQKTTRFIDVVAVDPKTGRIVEVHQVGRTLKSKPQVPVARERAALRDVRHSPELRGAKRFFHDYE